ncbi:MAG: metallophosphoesterase [Candidatus Thorarchaeota archaeon]
MNRDLKKQIVSDTEEGTNYAIAVSDVHLGYNKSDKKAFKEFIRNVLEREKIDHLILLGDILDFWRRDNKGLIEDSEDIFDMFKNLLEKQKIGAIHYVIGNHDFIIDTLDKRFPILAELFTFQSGISSKPKWFELPLAEENKSFTKNFRFIHGHQLREGLADPVIPWYDGLCFALCQQGDLLGRIASTAWEFRIIVPIIAACVTALLFYFSLTLWSIIAAIITVLLGIGIYGVGKRRELKEKLTFDEQVEVFIEALPFRTKRRIIRYLKSPPHKRRKLDIVSEKDVLKAYTSVEDKIPDIAAEKAHEIINNVLKTIPTYKSYEIISTTLSPSVHQVVGHTHHEEAGVDLTNLGCWEKGHGHHYLVINNQGIQNLKEFEWKKVSRWQKVKRKLRRQ